MSADAPRDPVRAARSADPLSTDTTTEIQLPGGYLARRLLGRGTFGVVAAGVDAAGGAVAIKVLTSTHVQAAQRFRREVKVMRALPVSPYVPRYVDDGVLPDGRPFLVMELVPGVPLETLLAGGRRFSVRAAAALLVSICESFGALHALGVTHADVKPANIILELAEGAAGEVRAGGVIHYGLLHRWQPRARLIDFGLMRDGQGLLGALEAHDLLRLQGTREATERDFASDLDTGVVAGTLQYLAPEQVEDAVRDDGAPALTDTRADVFALGVLFCRLVTGPGPWQAVETTFSEPRGQLCYLERRRAGQAPEVPGGMPPALQAIIRRALEARPSRRHHDAGELKDDLAHYLEHGAPRPLPPAWDTTEVACVDDSGLPLDLTPSAPTALPKRSLRAVWSSVRRALGGRATP